MRLSSPSDRQRVPKSLAFIALLGLLLIAAVAFAPNSSAGLPAFQNGGASGSKRSRPEFVPGEALVRFKTGRAFEGSTYMPVPNEGAAQRFGEVQSAVGPEEILVQVDRFDGSDLVDGLRIAHAADTGKAIAALRARDDVEYAEPNYIVHAISTPNDPCFPSNSLVACQSTSLYGMIKIGAPQAWDIPFIGSNSVVVGVIDEGIDISHPDLAANIWTNPHPGLIPGIAGDVNGYDFINNSGTIPPEQHATHVAGTIGAVGNNGVGVVGVNWQVKLMSLRFIDQATNNGSTADAIRAYNYAKQMRDLFVSSSGANGANIRALNASYGGGGPSNAERDALTALGNSGILFVAAAGNGARNTDITPNYPSGYNLTNMISVAATTQTDNLASSFSNFGVKSVLMGAPGLGILSTLPGNTYGVFSGTSMATPHVVGAAALVCAANSNVSVNQLHALLAFNGDIIPALQGITLTGRRLNVFKSIQALNEGDTTPPGTAGNFRVTSQTGRAINLAWTASGDDGAAGQASLYDISFTDQFTGAVIPLTTIAPVASGSPQTLSVNVPYRHTSGYLKLREFDNVGNEGTATTFPVTVDRLVADPYATTLSSPAALSTGGTALGLTFDDRYLQNYALPAGFTFPFFGQTYTTVTISTNGNLYFSTPRFRSCSPAPCDNADDVPSSIGDLATFKMIAGMWDDLDLRPTRRADADVYFVQPDSSHIIFRWQGVQFGDGTNGAPINFEIELNTNGTIKTRYGSGNTNLFPVVGISGGEPDVYVADALTSELSPISLTNAQGAVFTPRALVPVPTVQFSSSSYTVNEGDPSGHVNITLTRNGDTTSSASVSFATNDGAGLTNCNVFNGIASPRCDYTNTIGTMSFAAGETSKAFSIAIVDDSYAEGTETFTIGLNTPSGATLGAQSTATVTITDNDATTGPNPIDNTNFFVRQQYIDFLGREPDPLGFAGWTATINNCATDHPGHPEECDRIHVSQLFFQSAEFQDRGYFVYRFYDVAFGRKPDYSEFVPDLASVSGFLDVNQLEAAKVAFIAAFMARPAFVSAYNSLTNQQYVDTLLNTAGVTLLPSPATRQAMIDGLNNSTMTRAAVLRQIVESGEVSAKYNHQAYAVMEYFGYLRRQPDAFYLDWIAVLDATNDPRGMVTGFATSAEYRSRFGP
jgi:subtilisin family serine protease